MQTSGFSKLTTKANTRLLGLILLPTLCQFCFVRVSSTTPRRELARPTFEVKQDVTLKLIGKESNRPQKAYGHITGMNPDGTIIGVDIPTPPEWMYWLQRKRGVFMSGPIGLQLFFDHAGTWTDIHGFNHFKIT